MALIEKLICFILGHIEEGYTLWNDETFPSSKELLTYKCSRCNTEYYYDSDGDYSIFSEDLKKRYIIRVAERKMPNKNLLYNTPVYYMEAKINMENEEIAKKQKLNFDAFEKLCEYRSNKKKRETIRQSKLFNV